jgi:hypothetical protein
LSTQAAWLGPNISALCRSMSSIWKKKTVSKVKNGNAFRLKKIYRGDVYLLHFRLYSKEIPWQVAHIVNLRHPSNIRDKWSTHNKSKGHVFEEHQDKCVSLCRICGPVTNTGIADIPLNKPLLFPSLFLPIYTTWV